MRILFLGNANNPLLINLASELRKLDTSLSIDIVSEAPVINSSAAGAFNAIYALPSGKFFRSIRGVKTAWMAMQFRRTLRSIGKKYDAVQMFFMHVGYTRSLKLVRALSPKFIVTVFGSEIYRSPAFILKQLEPMARMADLVTASNPDTLRDFCKRFEIPQSKTGLARFGLRPLDAIVAQKDCSLSEHKIAAGLPKDSFVIACGYNATAGQQHEIMIDSIARMKAKLPANYLLVFPVAMGDPGRIEIIRSKLNAAGLKHHFIDKYLPDDQLAHFRAASDVMIQVQITDQLAGAMQEHICAGSLVITGSWLPYSILDQTGVVYWKVEKPEQVGERLAEIIQDAESNKKAVAGNMQRILDLSSWENNAKDWYKFFTR